MVWGVISALRVDYYCTARIVKVGPELMGVMEKWEENNDALIHVSDTADAAPLVICDVVSRCREVRVAVEKRHYVWRGYATGNTLA